MQLEVVLFFVPIVTAALALWIHAAAKQDLWPPLAIGLLGFAGMAISLWYAFGFYHPAMILRFIIVAVWCCNFAAFAYGIVVVLAAVADARQERTNKNNQDDPLVNVPSADGSNDADLGLIAMPSESDGPGWMS